MNSIKLYDNLVYYDYFVKLLFDNIYKFNIDILTIDILIKRKINNIKISNIKELHIYF